MTREQDEKEFANVIGHSESVDGLLKIFILALVQQYTQKLETDLIEIRKQRLERDITSVLSTTRTFIEDRSDLDVEEIIALSNWGVGDPLKDFERCLGVTKTKRDTIVCSVRDKGYLEWNHEEKRWDITDLGNQKLQSLKKMGVM